MWSVGLSRYEWSKRAAHYKKGYRLAFACLFAIILATVMLVFVSGLNDQPIDQEALAKDSVPLLFLFASIAAICHFGHSWAKSKLDELDS